MGNYDVVLSDVVVVEREMAVDEGDAVAVEHDVDCLRKMWFSTCHCN